MTAPPERPLHRSKPARIGVAALNILLPGLGLLRLGLWRRALAWFAPYLFVTTALLVFLRARVPGFGILIGTLLLIFLAAIAIVIGSVVATWRRSAPIVPPEWWNRWYVIVALAALSLTANGLSPSMETVYRAFYIPSPSMLPTLLKNDRLIADMRWRTPQVGNILLVHAPSGENRIYRVAALGGQSFAMKGVVPIVDGQAATQSPAGRMALGQSFAGNTSGQLLREHLPGELGSHTILKVMQSPQDDMPTIRIPAGSVFLLGDDRDLSADSRIPTGEMGVGILPVSAIIGRPLYFLWSADHHKIGRRADH